MNPYNILTGLDLINCDIRTTATSQNPCTLTNNHPSIVDLEMDIIHGLSNLELIETTQSSYQEQEQRDIVRNWLELPLDVMSLIFMKLGTIDILGSAQWVCTSWWKLSKQPHLFRSISMQKMWNPFKHAGSLKTLNHICANMRMVKMAREAVDRSCGQVVEFSVRYFATNELLYYISQQSESLGCLRLVYCTEVTIDGLTEVCKQFPQLEELASIFSCRFMSSEGLGETVGCLCPHLKSFRLNSLGYPPYNLDGAAQAIAENMPELRHLNLFGNCLTDDGLRAILYGCPHLQTLDLRRCFYLKFEGELKDIMSAANIKLRLPDDSDDDFERAFDLF